MAMAVPHELNGQELIHACVDQRSGDLRVIATGGQCKKGESPLEWNLQGPAGAEGPTGPPGPLGPVGPIGPRGIEGTAGPQGLRGVIGPAGPTGVQGSEGPAGPVGPPGSQGAQGPPGRPGAVGPQGLRGVEGPAGPMGPQGAEGPRGSSGVGLLKVVGANGAVAGYWVEDDRMRVQHPSGLWIYLRVTPPDVHREVSFAIGYTGSNCTGSAYDLGASGIDWWSIYDHPFIKRGRIVDDLVYVSRDMSENDVPLRSIGSMSNSIWDCYETRSTVTARRLDSFPLSDLNLPLGPYHLEGQD